MTPANTFPAFQIVSGAGDAVASKWKGCESRKSTWNGFYCRNRFIGMLLFESLDDDTYDRSIQPINIINEKTGFNNTVNSMMDHVWDGFYTG